MITTEKVKINDKEAEGIRIFTGNVYILIIKAEKGFLGCGYFDVNVANKFNDVAAIVSGVKTFDDMLNAAVVKASEKAKELGIKEGMTGKEALEKMI